ncbi:hypothetical protein G5B35_15720 [Parapusillimonas sp. SGNA-6]|nr:hypothetical protein [Parapusillimonas sp. SGNA-6]
MRIKHILLGAAFAAVAGTAWAHHGWSSYDADKPVKIETALVDVQYRNPHAEADIDYQGSRWDLILAPTRRMESRGLPPDALKPGKTIIIEGYPRRDGTHEIRAERITVDGKTIELR